MRGVCAGATALLKTVEISEIAATVAEKEAKISFSVSPEDFPLGFSTHNF
jgi:hypothetical protein